MALDNCLAQLGDAAHRGVLGEVLLDGCDSSVLDMTRSIEVGLAHSEVAQLDALGAQLCSLSRHGNGGRHFNAVYPRGKRRAYCSTGCHRHPPNYGLARLATEVAERNFLCSRCSTAGGTKSRTDPPRRKTSFTRRELRYEYASAGIMKTV